MKIAQIAPLFESTPPLKYGGTERVVSLITEELVKRGHDVTLFASGDSMTLAKLVAGWECKLKDQPHLHELAYAFLLGKLLEIAGDFDIIHSHIDQWLFPLCARIEKPVVTTLHGRLDLPGVQKVFSQFPCARFVSISKAQREPLPDANWTANVYHGLPKDLYRFHPTAQNYLSFVGRLCPEKGVVEAVHIANQSGIPLKIAGAVHEKDRQYFDNEVKPLLDAGRAEFVGELDDAQKNDFIGNSIGVLFPISSREPFGLVMIEAMACGVPVIAFDHGSVNEVMDHGLTGYICHSIEEAVAAVKKLPSLKRAKCREIFETRFTTERMVDDYINCYQSILSQESASVAA